MKKQSFENYLQEHFISLNEYCGIPITKDNCEELFERWVELSMMDVSEIIELAEKWGSN